MYDPSVVDEVVIGFGVARKVKLGVGDTFDLITPEVFASACGRPPDAGCLSYLEGLQVTEAQIECSGGAQAELVVVPSASVARVPEATSLEAAATLPMNGLTVRLALDRLALKPGQTLGVTGAAGAVGGYAVELGVSDGLRVIAVARSQDEALVKRLGAKTFVPSGDAAIRAVYDAAPGGVDGLIDAAVLDAAVLPAIRDGGKLATVRGFAGPSERGITIEPVRVASYLHNQEALDRLGRLVAEGRLTLRVAETLPPERAADAHRKLAGGGTRGRLVIVF